MAEDSLKRHHVPDESAKIRGAGESGFKFKWDNVFHPEELSDRADAPHRERVTGGGENAIDILLENSDSVDPELRLLFSDFLQDVYGVSDIEEIKVATDEDRGSLQYDYMEKLNNKNIPVSELSKISDKLKQLDYLLSEGLENKVRNNFIKWLNADEQEKVDYDLRGLSPKIIAKLEERENAKLRRQKVALTANLDKVTSKVHRFEMTAWLNAWTDPDANLQGFGIRYINGIVASVALLSDKYGITAISFNEWGEALGGNKYLTKNNGVPILGMDFGKAHLIAPGIGEGILSETIRTLEIDGKSHPDIPIKIIRR